MGGSGTRLVCDVLRRLGVHMGENFNSSLCSLEAVPMCYALQRLNLAQGIDPEESWQPRFPTADLLKLVAHTVAKLQREDRPWGFKLPQALFAMPQLDALFPEMILVYVVRNPLDFSDRLTAYYGEAQASDGGLGYWVARSLPLLWNDASPDGAGLDRVRYRMCLCWQLHEQWRRFLSRHMRVRVVRYEDLVRQPEATVARLAELTETGSYDFDLTLDDSKINRYPRHELLRVAAGGEFLEEHGY